MLEYGLILSGGGAKGSYELGVWKALKELDIKIKGVAGTSIGALNGAMIVQDDYEVAYKLWKTISLDQIIDLDTSFLNKHLLKWTLEDFSLFLSTFKNFIKDKGFDTRPLRKLLEETIIEEKIRKSKMDFAINTYSISNREPIELYIDEIPKGQLIPYLLASACLPIFKIEKIDNIKYIDGGIYDNVPINLLAKIGYKNLIVVELLPIDIRRPPIKDDLNIITIKTTKPLGGIMDFDPKKAKINIKQGYLDTMEAFQNYNK